MKYIPYFLMGLVVAVVAGSTYVYYNKEVSFGSGAGGSIWFFSGGNPTLVTTVTDGCAEWSSNSLTSTGVTCASGGGGGGVGWATSSDNNLLYNTEGNQILLSKNQTATNSSAFLEIWGDVRADYFTASSTSGTSTLPFLSVQSAMNLFGTFGTALSDFCVAITGGAGLCDGTDADTQLTQEQVEDFAGAMVTGNTETLITVTYQDADGTIDYVVDNDLANYSNTNSAFLTTVDISANTNLVAGTNITLVDDTLNVDDAFLVNNADDTTSGRLTVNGLNSSSTLAITAVASGQVTRFFENTGGEYFDMQVNSSGDLLFVSDDGNTKLQLADNGDDMFIPASLTHLGDENTTFSFLDDRFTIQVGGINFLDFIEGVTDVVTALGEWDFGGATSLEIPNGTNPAVDATGEIAIKTATSTVEFYDGTNQQVVSPYFDLSFQLASTTLDTALNSFDTGTTTFYLRNQDGKVELEKQYCKTNAGTLSVNVGDGTNWADQLIANSSGAEDTSIASNSTFTDREDIQVRIGSGATSPSRIQCTLTFRRTP